MAERLKINRIMMSELLRDEMSRFEWYQRSGLHLPGAYIATMRAIHQGLGPRLADLAGRADQTELVGAVNGFFGDLVGKETFDDLNCSDVDNFESLLITLCHVQKDEELV